MQHPTEAQHKQDATTANATREPSGSNNVVISLSREYGSGGREIGEKLSARLGYSYYDKVLLKRLAERSGLADEVIESFDEKPFSRLLLNPNRFLSGSDGYPLAQQIHTAEIDLVRSYHGRPVRHRGTLRGFHPGRTSWPGATVRERAHGGPRGTRHAPQRAG